MIDNSFTIKPYHWWLTIGVAMVLHIFLLINYQQESSHLHDHVNTNQNEVIIGLKKLKHPPIIEKPSVIETVAVTPVPVQAIKPKPIVKKKKIFKSKPIIKSTPKVVSPTVNPPQIAPLKTINKLDDTSSREVSNNPSPLTTNTESGTIKKEKALYYATLAQWLERHKKYPTIARRRNQQGEVTIKFVLNRQGDLLRYELVTPSEHHSLNTATIKMLERASPMPIPPKEIIGEKTELEFTIPVNFNLLNK